jgi:hypothetical protein
LLKFPWKNPKTEIELDDAKFYKRITITAISLFSLIAVYYIFKYQFYGLSVILLFVIGVLLFQYRIMSGEAIVFKLPKWLPLTNTRFKIIMVSILIIFNYYLIKWFIHDFGKPGFFFTNLVTLIVFVFEIKVIYTIWSAKRKMQNVT